MAALVEPLGLERGKRARGPCPPEPRFPPFPRKARAGVGGAPPVRRSMGVGGSVGEPAGEGRPPHTPAWVRMGIPAAVSPSLPATLRLSFPGSVLCSSLLGLWLRLSMLCVSVSLCVSMPAPAPQTCPEPWSSSSGCSAAGSCPRRSCRPSSASCRAASVPPSGR